MRHAVPARAGGRYCRPPAASTAETAHGRRPLRQCRGRSWCVAGRAHLEGRRGRACPSAPPRMVRWVPKPWFSSMRRWPGISNCAASVPRTCFPRCATCRRSCLPASKVVSSSPMQPARTRWLRVSARQQAAACCTRSKPMQRSCASPGRKGSAARPRLRLLRLGRTAHDSARFVVSWDQPESEVDALCRGAGVTPARRCCDSARPGLIGVDRHRRHLTHQSFATTCPMSCTSRERTGGASHDRHRHQRRGHRGRAGAARRASAAAVRHRPACIRTMPRSTTPRPTNACANWRGQPGIVAIGDAAWTSTATCRRARRSSGHSPASWNWRWNCSCRCSCTSATRMRISWRCCGTTARAEGRHRALLHRPARRACGLPAAGPRHRHHRLDLRRAAWPAPAAADAADSRRAPDESRPMRPTCCHAA